MEVWRGRCRAFEGGRNAKSGIISVVFVPSRPWAGGRCVPGRPRCLASGAAPGAPGGPGARAARDSREGVGRKGLSSEGPARGRTRRPAWPWPPAPQGTGGGGSLFVVSIISQVLRLSCANNTVAWFNSSLLLCFISYLVALALFVTQ